MPPKIAEVDYIDYSGIWTLLNLYQDSYLQEYNQMEIDYEKGQSISFSKRGKRI